MKKFLTACGLLAVTFAVAAAMSAAMPDYSGTWTLDKSKSKDLPPMMVSAETLEMTVTQDKEKLTIKNSLSGDEVSYKLDGSKAKAQMGGRMPGEATIYLEQKEDGKVVLHVLRELNFQGNAVTITITESWELMDNGKTLKAKRTVESPRGTQEMEMVYTKKV
ncbi:MAG TPA: hypothetical protein VJT09_09175 [Pyrinomonadaceae bacterium]|nr:hypothetical protein [Pyrinomonadaceae bacterium]